MRQSAIIWKFFAALPAFIFWFWYFQPLRIDGSENWLRFAVLLLATLLSALLFLVSLIQAFRVRTGVWWWLIAALNFSVIAMFFFN